MVFEPGRAVGPYEIIRVLGSGGMGTVCLARDRRLERQVALKFLHGDPASSDPVDWHARLLREARAASALNHPNICHVYDVGGEGTDAWIAMEYVDGEPLQTLVGGGGLPPAQVVTIARQIADGLAHAHAHGVLHRDLKSANVVVDRAGRARILDFGIAGRTPEAVAHEATHTATKATPGGVTGTLAYLAPEILRGGPATERSDLWSLGVLMFEMLTGAVPFKGVSPFDVASSILAHPPPALPARVPAAVREIVLRLLEKDPSARYRSASEVASALGGPSAAPRPMTQRRLPIITSAVALAALALLAALAVIAYGVWRARQFVPVQVAAQRLLSTTGGAQRAPSLAPDGQRLA